MYEEDVLEPAVVVPIGVEELFILEYSYYLINRRFANNKLISDPSKLVVDISKD